MPISVTNQATKNSVNASNSAPTYMYFPVTMANEEFALRKVTLKIFESQTLLSVFDNSGEKIEQFTKEIQEKNDKISKQDGAVNKSSEAINQYGNLVREMKRLNAKFEFSIVLPIPNELSDVYSHDYGVENGIIGSIGSDSMSSDKDDSKGIKAKLKSAGGAISGATKAMLGDFNAKLAGSLGKQRNLLNPDFFQNYRGSAPRTFTFTFNLIPNSKKEAEDMVNIILTLKKYSSPKVTASFLMTQPRFFCIEFGNPQLNKMINALPCVLQEVNTNYSAGGYVDTTLDGMPKYVSLQLTFAEYRAIDFDDWDNVDYGSYTKIPEK